VKIYKALKFAYVVIILSGCVYLPKTNDNVASINACKTFTKSMSLEKIELKKSTSESDNSSSHNSPSLGCGGGDACAKAVAVIAAGVIIVAAGSAIISGSIVVVNNTAHWMEYQGTCSDGYLNQSKQWFLEKNTQRTPADISGSTL
jgi:hypothetical protein